MSQDYWTSDIEWAKETRREELFENYQILMSEVPDDEKSDAITAFSKIAFDGSLAAAIYLACYYFYHPHGREKYRELALQWLEHAASMGSRSAALEAIKINLKDGVDVDRSEQFLRKLASDGYLPAKLKLAIYRRAKDRDIYREEYLNLLRSASRSGHVFARSELSRIAWMDARHLRHRTKAMLMYVNAVITGVPVIVRYGCGNLALNERIY